MQSTPQTPTDPLKDNRRPSILLLSIIALLDLIAWALTGGILALTRERYIHTALLPYEPEPTLPLLLGTLLPPLILDTLFVPLLFVLALQSRLHPVLLLSVAVVAFALWLGLGIWNSIIYSQSITEIAEPDLELILCRAVGAVQCLLGVGWFVGLIAAGRWTDRWRRERFLERRARGQVGR